MKSDLDRLMQARDLDAVVINGKVLGNPPLVYMLNGAKLTQVHMVKKRGQLPQLIVAPMEREQAAQAGYPVLLNTHYNMLDLLREHQGDLLAASVAYEARIFDDLDVAGRVGYYGYRDQGEAYVFLQTLNAALPDTDIVGEFGTNLIQEARATKDVDEVARIRDVGRRTADIVRQTITFLQEHRVGDDQCLHKPDSGEPLTVQDVHARINHLIAAHGLEDPKGFIFATGRDAGIPHSKGTPDAPLRLGESIVFDIFPREAGGGYFFDMTRTFCLGYAPEPLQILYDDVLACLHYLKPRLRAGEETRAYQRMACEFFHARGHTTLADDAATLEGYVHGLGHGVGLDIHETPSFQDHPGNGMTLQPGHVFTLEPGLYYPDAAMGCRLEDVLWIDDAGTLHTLMQYPFELVVPVG